MKLEEWVTNLCCAQSLAPPWIHLCDAWMYDGLDGRRYLSAAWTLVCNLVYIVCCFEVQYVHFGPHQSQKTVVQSQTHWAITPWSCTTACNYDYRKDMQDKTTQCDDWNVLLALHWQTPHRALIARSSYIKVTVRRKFYDVLLHGFQKNISDNIASQLRRLKTAARAH